MTISKDVRAETTTDDGHSHVYAERVAEPNRVSYTAKSHGHRHRINRDGAGKAVSFEREFGEDGTTHTHRINP